MQGLVAVSDGGEIETIKVHAADVTGLYGRLKYWDYEEVLRVSGAKGAAPWVGIVQRHYRTQRS